MGYVNMLVCLESDPRFGEVFDDTERMVVRILCACVKGLSFGVVHFSLSLLRELLMLELCCLLLWCESY